MSPTFAETLVTGIHVTALLVTVAASIRLLRRRPRSLAVFYFHFAIISELTSMLYWLVYDLLQSQTRMPFAANEFAEAASFLMFAASMSTVDNGRFRDARTEVALTALFGICNAALWVVWNGEWAEFILGGAAYTYFLCVCARCLKRSGVLTRQQWTLMGVSALAVLLLQLAWTLWEHGRPVLDHVGAALPLSVGILLAIRFLCACRSGEDWRSRFMLATCIYAWSVTTMYMTTGVWYLAAELLSMLTLPMMLTQLGQGAEP